MSRRHSMETRSSLSHPAPPSLASRNMKSNASSLLAPQPRKALKRTLDQSHTSSFTFGFDSPSKFSLAPRSDMLLDRSLASLPQQPSPRKKLRTADCVDALLPIASNIAITTSPRKQLLDIVADKPRFSPIPQSSIDVLRQSSLGLGLPSVTAPKPVKPPTLAPSGIPRLATRPTPLTELDATISKLSTRRHSVAPPKFTPFSDAKPASRRVSLPAAPLTVKAGNIRTDSKKLVKEATAKTTAISKPQPLVLKDVTAFVDVRTAEGDDAGQVFVNLLKAMGARAPTRPTTPLTHIIYKSGKPTTLTRYHTHPEPKPKLVGIAWVVACKETNSKIDETPYLIKLDQLPLASNKARRKSMEPRALLQTSSAPLRPTASRVELERRKTLAHLPKVSSPLKRAVYVMPEEDEE